jgi:hypothetical protein
MKRDEGWNYLPVWKRLPSQESQLKYDADAVATGPEQIAGGVTSRAHSQFVEGLPCGM